jgi:hypothetical protein
MITAAGAPSPATFPRPRSVTLLAALNGLAAAIYLGLGVLMLFFGAMPPNVDDPRVGAIAGALLAAAGLFHLVNAFLLWRLRPFGRILQIVQSAIWVWAIPVGTIVSLFVLYYLTRPGVRLLFSGQPWPSMPPEAQRLVERDADHPAIVLVIGTLVALTALFLLGVVASLVFPGLFGTRGM